MKLREKEEFLDLHSSIEESLRIVELPDMTW
jgi:hypothetical protein